MAGESSASCAQCEASPAKVLRCSGCGEVTYCNQVTAVGVAGSVAITDASSGLSEEALEATQESVHHKTSSTR